MPPSVLVVSRDPDLFAHVRDALAGDARFVVGGDLVHCDGSTAPLTNLYPITAATVDREAWVPPDGEAPHPAAVATLVLECRSADWVAELGALLAGALDEPVWFVDARDGTWPADGVDPGRVALT